MTLQVHYGFTKLKPSITKIELVAVFENSEHCSIKREAFIQKAMHVVYSRKQTEGEAEDGQYCSRILTKYRYFIDDKPFNGDIEKALHQNFEADSNNVSLEERNLIREKLREAYYKLFNRKPLRQLTLEL